MFMSSMCCNKCAKSGLRGLADSAGAGQAIGGTIGGAYGGPIGAAFGSAIGGAIMGGDSGGGGAAPGTVVATNVNTSISPQISPNFIQQQQPNNSAVNASTNQSMPDPFGNSLPMPMSPLPPSYAPAASGLNYNVLIFGALAAVGVAIAIKKSKSQKPAVSTPNYKRLN